jgi:DNA-binding NarL/FixJ family response regulator
MRVLIADRRQEVRDALGFLLSQEPDICVAGESGNSQDLLACLELVCPDVVLLDCELPGLPMADLLAQLHAHDSHPKVLVLCSKSARGRAALLAGADTLIDKSAHPRRLVTALRVLQLESEYE